MSFDLQRDMLQEERRDFLESRYESRHLRATAPRFKAKRSTLRGFKALNSSSRGYLEPISSYFMLFPEDMHGCCMGFGALSRRFALQVASYLFPELVPEDPDLDPKGGCLTAKSSKNRTCSPFET